MNKGNTMKLEEDFFLKLLIFLGFGTLGGLAKYLDYRNSERKKNPKFNERFFSGLLLTSILLGMITAIAFGFVVLELLPNLSLGMLVSVSIVTGASGYAGLQAMWRVIVQSIAKQSYGVEIRQVVTDKIAEEKRGQDVE